MQSSLKSCVVAFALAGMSLAAPDPSCDMQGKDGDAYWCGDKRLGPAVLPSKMCNLVVGFDRLGGQTPKEFLGKWYNSTGNTWLWPEKKGYLVDDKKEAMKHNFTMPVGIVVDRIGKDNGSYLALEGTAFAQRAIPPMHLNPPPEKPAASSVPYYLWRVMKPFNVSTGPIAPFFGQPGLGTQFLIPNRRTSLQLVAACILQPLDLDRKPVKQPGCDDVYQQALKMYQDEQNSRGRQQVSDTCKFCQGPPQKPVECDNVPPKKPVDCDNVPVPTKPTDPVTTKPAASNDTKPSVPIVKVTSTVPC